MTVKETSDFISKELQSIYPDSEISTITHLIFSELLNFKRFDAVLRAGSLLPEHAELQIYNIIEQLKRHRPIQYVLGCTEFYGLPFSVSESVLIPRPETEELVHCIVGDYKNRKPRIVDFGTGSGCIAITLAKELPGAEVLAVDVSPEALSMARKNAERNQVNVEFLQLDILSSTFPDLGGFDVIVSNPPYVTQAQKSDMDANVLDYEPHLALFVPENDPLLFYKAIGRFAQKSLNPGGGLYFEINEDLPYETASAIEKLGFSAELKKDLNDKFRMLKAVRNDKG
ncbi:MAG: peptide chain release factor N(5)-glutamine methyltransferase [Bacteroidota bacterium]|nr:peptide chain release factor N(5)-glutamine methyltransferase [Bacteroidota bacterium]